jgi:hypothetical protein
MTKIIFTIMLSFSFTYAGLINAIAITVNDDPITLVDIDNKILEKRLSKDQAVVILIDELLYKQSLKKHAIGVDFFDVDNYIEQLAKQNKMSVFAFKSAVKQQQDYDQFVKDIRNRLKHQKLISTIASGKINKATDEDLKIYYNNNKSQFQIAKTIEAIHYTSRDKKALQNLQVNPMMVQSGVSVKNITLTQDSMSAQMKYIANQTNTSKFSAIFAENKTYNMLFISDKKDMETLSFDKVRNQIFRVVMNKREQDFLKSYFETLKLTAKIKVLR